MRAIKGKILVRFGNGKGIMDSITFDSGAEIFIHGEERPEVWANCIATVISSGVEGINDGDVIGCNYQATFDYDLKDNGERIYKNAFVDPSDPTGNSLIFKISEDMVIFVRHSEPSGLIGLPDKHTDIPFGNWRIMTEQKWGDNDIQVGIKRGRGTCIVTGETLYFEERFRGELYLRKYIVLTEDRIVYATPTSDDSIVIKK